MTKCSTCGTAFPGGFLRKCKTCGTKWCSACARRGVYGSHEKSGPSGDKCPDCGGVGMPV